jgi:hypothetical protein
MKKIVIILSLLLVTGLIIIKTGYTKPAKEYCATLTDVKGEVELKKAGDDDDFWTRAKLYTGLEETDELRTGDESSVEITFDNGTVLVLKENTNMKLMSVIKQLKMKLKKGKLLSSVIKQHKGAVPHSIQTPTSVAAVRGTEFAIEVGDEKSTSIGVFEGQVSVKKLLGEDQVAEEEMLVDPDMEATIDIDKPLMKPVQLGETMKTHKSTMKALNSRFERIRKELDKYRGLRMKEYEKFRNKKDKEIEKFRGKNDKSKESDKFKKQEFGK